MKKIIVLSKWLMSLLLLSLSTASYSGPTYNVNSIIGVGSVTGTIETDGTIGVLATANILNWNLVLNDGSSTFTITGNNSAVLVQGSALTTTTTQILFDFSTTAIGFVLFQNPSIGSGINFWCLESATGNCANNPSAETVRLSAAYVNTPRVGNTAIASTSSVTTTPANVPTLSFWGVLMMSLLLGYVGIKRNVKFRP